jgi:hypothetical protein
VDISQWQLFKDYPLDATSSTSIHLTGVYRMDKNRELFELELLRQFKHDQGMIAFDEAKNDALISEIEGRK